MATVEVLKMMRSVDDKVNVVLDGAHYIVIKPSTLCGAFIFLVGRETKQVTQQTASYVGEAKRSSPHFISISFRGSLTLTGEQLRQDIHKWFSPPDPSINHNTACSVQHQVVATWFFDGGIYKEWKSSPSFLWVHGKRTSLSPSASLIFTASCLSQLVQARVFFGMLIHLFLSRVIDIVD